MYHELPRTARFWSFLRAVDQDLAKKTREKGCPCGGRLHSANYPRKPRGTPVQLPEEECLRLSFCCDRDGCRKRTTPPSVRFLGPKVYLGAIVILISAMRQGPTPRRVRELSQTFRCRPPDHRSLAGLLARTLSADAVLEDRSRRFHAGCRHRQPGLFAGGYLPSPSSHLQGLDAPAAVSLTDYGSRSPANRGLAMIAFDPQKMLIDHPD